MNKKLNFNTLQLLLCGTIFTGFFIYFSAFYGLYNGIYVTFLAWSFYILVIPGGHGQLLIGLPSHYITTKRMHTEYFFWVIAIIFNAITVTLYPEIYSTSLLTYFFYQLLTNPNPGWLIFAISGLGTFYNAAFNLPYFGSKQQPHAILRPLLIALGVAFFIYLAHQELIICANILAQ